jgi:phosphoribosyl 1,2-cyclic phosphodiesterase
MKVHIHGVRGSIASPGLETAFFGGNTPCLEVVADGSRLVLDAGSGLRNVGDRILAEGKPADFTLLFSHYHWDHLQGLPFFAPLYMAASRIACVGPRPGALGLRDSLRQQMAPPFFPVPFDSLPSHLTTRELRLREGFVHGGFTVKSAPTNHPDPCFAYRIEHGGRSLVYATDTEHYDCVDPELLRLARGADLLVYDAQYLPEEYAGQKGPPRTGWGHSTYEAGARLAQAAGVGALGLFHHDPRRNDDGVREIEARARDLFPATFALREGEVIDLAAPLVDRVAA